MWASFFVLFWLGIRRGLDRVHRGNLVNPSPRSQFAEPKKTTLPHPCSPVASMPLIPVSGECPHTVFSPEASHYGLTRRWNRGALPASPGPLLRASLGSVGDLRVPGPEAACKDGGRGAVGWFLSSWRRASPGAAFAPVCLLIQSAPVPWNKWGEPPRGDARGPNARRSLCDLGPQSAGANQPLTLLLRPTLPTLGPQRHRWETAIYGEGGLPSARAQAPAVYRGRAR